MFVRVKPFKVKFIKAHNIKGRFRREMFTRVYVEITNICNMKCSFCHGHSRPSKMMEEGEFLRVLEQLKGKTQYIYYHLMGEPLIHPKLADFIKTAKQNGFKSIITTNGTLLKENGEKIISAGIHKINISLHSFEEGSAVKFNDYLSGVAEFAKKANDEGVIVVMRLWNKGVDDGKNQDVIAFLRSKIDGEWLENTKGIRVRKNLYVEWGERFVWPDKHAENLGEDVFCYGTLDHFGILCDGTVVPCCLDGDGVVNLGNVFTQELSDIINSKRFKEIRKGFESKKATEDLCKRCSYARRFKV